MDVFLFNSALTLLSLIANNVGIKSLFELRNTGSADQIPLTDEPLVYYVRRERKDRRRVINVFDQNGNKKYTIERKTQFSPIWCFLEYPGRIEVSTIRAGLFDQSVDFHHKPGLQHRGISIGFNLTGPYRKFYLNDGAEYEWSRPTRYLERVINPGGGDEERRERIAKARLMRRYRFDYEVLIDPKKIDPEVALSTAFISMNTQWGLYDANGTRGPTPVQKQLLGLKMSDKHKVADDDDNNNNNTSENFEIEHYNPETGTVEVENRVFLVLEKPDGIASEPIEVGTGNRQSYAPNYAVPLKQLQLDNSNYNNRVSEIRDSGNGNDVLSTAANIINGQKTLTDEYNSKAKVRDQTQQRAIPNKSSRL